MRQKWYVWFGGKSVGPIDAKQLQSWALTGVVSAEDPVSLNGLTWVRANRVRGLRFASPSDAQPHGWYIRTNEGEFGPFNSTQLNQLGEAEKIDGSEEIRKGRKGDWHAACRVKGLKVVSRQAIISTSNVETESNPIGAVPDIPDRKRCRQRRPEFFTISDLLLASLMTAAFMLPSAGGTPSQTGILLLACTSLLVGLLLFWNRWQPDRQEQRWAFASMLFVGVFGATSLLVFTDFAISAAQVESGWNGGPLTLFKAIGSLYEATIDSSGGRSASDFLRLWLATTFSIGMSEECLKLIPVAMVVLSGSRMRPQGISFLGAASGFAFGLAEGLWISCQVELPNRAPLSTFLVRLLGCPLCHAVMTSLAATIVSRIIGQPHGAGTVRRSLAAVFCSAMILAAAHGLYDVMLALGRPVAAGLTMMALTISLIVSERQISLLHQDSG